MLTVALQAWLTLYTSMYAWGSAIHLDGMFFSAHKVRKLFDMEELKSDKAACMEVSFAVLRSMQYSIMVGCTCKETNALLPFVILYNESKSLQSSTSKLQGLCNPLLLCGV
jgi:hypothetical protein